MASMPDAYRPMLKSIHDELTSHDLKSLKFLCLDFIPPGQSEKIKSSLDLFQKLENLKKIQPTDLLFVGRLLELISRRDIIHKLGFHDHDIQNDNLVSPYRVLLYHISQDLTEDNLQSLKFCCNLSKSEMGNVRDCMDFILLLQKKGKISEQKLADLAALMSAVDRKDLEERVQQCSNQIYEQSLPRQQSLTTNQIFPRQQSFPSDQILPRQQSFPSDQILPRQQSFPSDQILPRQQSLPRNPILPSVYTLSISNRPVTSSTDSFAPHEPNIAFASNLPLSSNICVSSRRAVPNENCSLNVPSSPRSLLQTSEQLTCDENISLTTSSSELEEEDCYKMNRKPRGICLIINNEKFYKDTKDNRSKELKERNGTNIDRDKLKVLFEKLDFLVEVRNDLKHSDMITEMKLISLRDHSQFDCFICCIMTHGLHGELYGTDGLTIEIKEIMNFVKPSGCLGLANKPKMFFIQACQGEEYMPGYEIEEDSDSERKRIFIPNEADFFVAMSTPPGYLSYRSRSDGSWFMSALAEVLDKNADKKSITDILIEVNRKVSDKLAPENCRQIPIQMCALRKKVFLR